LVEQVQITQGVGVKRPSDVPALFHYFHILVAERGCRGAAAHLRVWRWHRGVCGDARRRRRPNL